ncbi:MAG: UDP-glucose/GDP-mannose dehydrogenase family protein [Acidobacteria bacterium]|nr:MAG: UDP-glucose/GDP-mannose dehydrogenase family protein [Acidobacteriota bacterium]
MKISVFGLGYVGCVSAACLARLGNEVVGVDVNQHKVDLINAGQSTIVEEEIAELVKNAVCTGLLTATASAVEAVARTEISLVCVGTPSRENGSLDLSYIQSSCRSIGEGLAAKDGYHVVVIRSTMLPGSTRTTVIPVLESSSGKKAGKDFGVCVNPEFLREGSSVRDFLQPPYTLIGCDESSHADQVEKMYEAIEAETVKVPIETAEMIKYASNSFHAVKICFANEIGRLCKALGVDPQQLMEIFAKDSKLNISKAYLRPGFAFGGSCLPKDVRALNHFARVSDVDVPLLASLLPSNHAQLEQALRLITKGGRRNVGVVGLSFKPGTDDLRESPLVLLVEHLIGRGFPVMVYDANVHLSRIFGANKQYIEKEIPHIEKLMVGNLEELVDFADVLVVGHRKVDLSGFNVDGKEVIQLER